MRRLIMLAVLSAGLFFFVRNHSYSKSLEIPLGLPPIPWPQNNLYSKSKADLGRLLYFDKRLSSDQTVSCASCHQRACGFGDCRKVSVGIGEQKGSRHSPTIINTAYSRLLFWDGRASSLEEQCKGPLANFKEMSDLHNEHEAHLQCVRRVSEIRGYKKLFQDAFGSTEVTLDRIAQAIATFERTILSGNSPYDRYMKGNKTALTQEQLRGLEVFNASGCANCHSDFNFSDDRFHNIGIGMQMPTPDLGRFTITHNERDWGAFRTPTLREVVHNPPYMHDGSLSTLEAVIEYYDRGGFKNKNLHPLIRPLHLTQADKNALVGFLKALSGEGWQHFSDPDVEEFPN